MDEVVLDGKTYIASKKAASECGYTQDYVGQLCRGGHIDARRVSGHWYINLESLRGYKAKADLFKPEPPKYAPDPHAESSLTIEGKEYVSAGRAAKLANYAQDYVGQLARAGKIPSKQIGNRWYVEKEALLSHKSEKDALLAAVQAQSVGLKKAEPEQNLAQNNVSLLPAITIQAPVGYPKAQEPLLTYSVDTRALLPLEGKHEPEIIETAPEQPVSAPHAEMTESLPTTESPEPEVVVETVSPVTPPASKVSIPIHVVKPASVAMRTHQVSLSSVPRQSVRVNAQKNSVSIPRKSIFSKLFLGSAATVALVIIIAIGALKSSAIYSLAQGSQGAAVSASVGVSIQSFGDYIETFLGHELVYTRGE
jgi:hypothetical protein